MVACRSRVSETSTLGRTQSNTKGAARFNSPPNPKENSDVGKLGILEEKGVQHFFFYFLSLFIFLFPSFSSLLFMKIDRFFGLFYYFLP